MHLNLKENHIELRKKKAVRLAENGALQKRPENKNYRPLAKAGGRDAVFRSFIDHRFKVNVTSEQWSSISLALANTTKGKYHKCLKWLRVIWDEDRRGVRTEVLHAGSPTVLNLLC